MGEKWIDAIFAGRQEEITPHIKAKLLNSYKNGNIEEMTHEDLESLVDDINFFSQTNIPVENICSRFDNYIPENASQRRLAKVATGFVGMPLELFGGLVISGEPGVGKTHISVSAAKKFMRLGLQPSYTNLSLPNKQSRLPTKKNNGVILLDDMNDLTDECCKLFCDIITKTYTDGGKLLVTTNHNNPEHFVHQAICQGTNCNEKEMARLKDRTNKTLLPLHVEGTSHRQDSWFQDL